jgi:hypothetical protein
MKDKNKKIENQEINMTTKRTIFGKNTKSKVNKVWTGCCLGVLLNDVFESSYKKIERWTSR